MKKSVKILLWIISSILVLMVAVLLLISPLAKYMIEKNGEEYSGRQLKLNNININLLNGHVSLTGFKMMSQDKKEVFVSCDTFALDVALSKFIFSRILNINYIKINGLTTTITQKGDIFNFDDILKKFSAPDTTKPVQDTTVSEPFKYIVHNISLKNGHFIYKDLQLGSTVEVIKSELNCSKLSWDDPKMKYDFSFALQSKGEVDGSFSFVTETMDYLMSIHSKAVNLALINPYLKGYMNISAFEGDLDSDLKLKGNFNKPSAIAVKGSIAVNNLFIADKNDKQTLSWKKLSVDVDSLNTEKNVYNIKNIALNDPYLLFEMYDKGGNNFYDLMNMAPDSVTAPTAATSSESSSANPFKMLVDMVGEMTKEYIITDYNIDNFNLTGGTILYKDFTMEDKFQYEMEELSLESSGIRSDSKKVSAALHSKLNKLGKLEMLATINPSDFTNMELICKIQDAPVPDFSPYSKYYVAHPFNNGRVSFNSENKLVNNFLNSNNELNIANMEVGKKVKRKDAMNVPVRLAVSLLKDTKGNIHLKVPVEGDLNDPKYKLRKTIWGVVENIIVKAATAPFRLLASTFGGNEEDLKEMKFEYLKTALTPEQIKSLDKLADIMTQKPEINLEITQTAIKEAEKEQMAILEAKKKYFNDVNKKTDSLSPVILKQINDISLKDSSFNAYLDSKLKLTPGNITPQITKCINLLGSDFLNKETVANFTKREAYISDYLTRIKKIKVERIRFLPVDEKSITAETPPRMVFNITVEP